MMHKGNSNTLSNWSEIKGELSNVIGMNMPVVYSDHYTLLRGLLKNLRFDIRRRRRAVV